MARSCATSWHEGPSMVTCKNLEIPPCGTPAETALLRGDPKPGRRTKMAGGSSDGVLRQVHRLFNMGVVGTMTDAQLLDWFLSRRDEAAEAAFEELMNR